MSLIDNMMTTCCFVEKTRVSDGAGGFNVSWADGEEFDAAITNDTSMQSRIAEHDGVTSTYTITTKKAVILEFHDVLKRKSDGKIFRVTSYGSDKESPIASTLDISQVSAEKWELTS